MMPQRIIGQYKDNTNFIQGKEIKDGTRGFANQGICGMHVRENVVIIDRDEHGMRRLCDRAFINRVMPVWRILSPPTVLMQFNDEVVTAGGLNNRLAHAIDTSRFIGGGEEDRRAFGIQAETAAVKSAASSLTARQR